MKKVEITLNSDGSYTCSQDKIYIGEHMAVELEITLPEDMQTGFESYALCLDPSGMCKKIIISGIKDAELNESAKARFSEGVIYCALPREFTETPELYMQAEARVESGNSVTYVEKTGIFCVKFDKSIVGREFVTDPCFSGIFDPEKYTVNDLGHTHSYNSLLDLPELYQPDNDVHIKFVSLADEDYREPMEVINPGDYVTLPPRFSLIKDGKKRKVYGWKLHETDERIFDGAYRYPIPRGFKGTITFYAQWSANYYEYIGLTREITNMANGDSFPVNSNDVMYIYETYRSSSFEEEGIDALLEELELANSRVNTMNCPSQKEVDMQVKKLRDLLNGIKLKKLPARIACSEGAAHDHNWKNIVNYCVSLFGEDVTLDTIALNTPIPEDCIFTDQSMAALREKLVDLKDILILAMSDMYRIPELSTMTMVMGMLYNKYHALTRKTSCVVDMVSTTVSVSTQDGVEYKYGTLNTLSITLPAEPRYKTRITFTSGNEATVVAFTAMPVWADGEIPEIAAGRTYQIDIEDGLAVWRGFYAAS